MLPGFWVALQPGLGWLAPKRISEAIHQIGFWPIRLMLASPLAAPLRTLGDWPRLVTARRMLSVGMLAYTVVNQVPLTRVLSANLDFDDDLCPAPVGAGGGVCLVAIHLARCLWSCRTAASRPAQPSHAVA